MGTIKSYVWRIHLHFNLLTFNLFFLNDVFTFNTLIQSTIEQQFSLSLTDKNVLPTIPKKPFEVISDLKEINRRV